MNRFLLSLAGLCLLSSLMSCGGAVGRGRLSQPGPDPVLQPVLDAGSLDQPRFPIDNLQPGESLNADGYLIPSRNAVASALSVNDDFLAGRDYFDSSGSVGKDGAAASIQSGAGSSAWTLHRFPLGGSEPGVLSVDANLQPGNQYYAAAANFTTGRWDWSGPFSDSHVRILLDPDSSHLSSLGNAWVAVLTHDGAELELVSLALARRAVGDTDPPAEVTGVGGTVTGGSIDLSWDPVADGDLAGYAVHYSTSSFNSPDAVGVRNIGYLEGSTRHQLTLPQGVYYIRVAAVDINGNRGPFASGSITADIQSDTQRQLSVIPASTLVPVGAELGISVSGAELYDLDLDGDGVFEITASGAAEHTMQPQNAGILRPRVRGYDSGGTYTALGGLSVLVSIANLPPFADICASATNVAIGQLVKFEAGNSIDLDGSIAKYEWDFEGDGAFDLDSGTDPGASWTYSAAGRYPARIRVTDDSGAQTVAAVSITVRGAEFIPLAECGFCPGLTLETVNGVPALCFMDSSTKLPYYALAGDSSGQSWGTPVKIHDNDNCNYEVALAVVDGNPAVAFYDDTPGGVMYARASAADGSSWGTAVLIDSGVSSGYQLDLTLINGRPAVLHYGGDIVYYTRAADALGSAWGTTVTLDSTAGTGSNPVLLDAVDRPLAVFSRSTGSPSSWRSAEGNDADGGSWGIAIEGSDSDWNSASRLDAIGLQSGLLACYVAQTTSLDELRVKYQPGVPENQWIATKLVSRSTNFGKLRMGIAGGLPFIVFHEHLAEHRLIFVPALDASGNSWGEEILLTSFDDIGLDDFDVGIADGQPVIVYKSFADDYIRFGTIYH